MTHPAVNLKSEQNNVFGFLKYNDNEIFSDRPFPSGVNGVEPKNENCENIIYLVYNIKIYWKSRHAHVKEKRLTYQLMSDSDLF